MILPLGNQVKKENNHIQIFMLLFYMVSGMNTQKGQYNMQLWPITATLIYIDISIMF